MVQAEEWTGARPNLSAASHYETLQRADDLARASLEKLKQSRAKVAPSPRPLFGRTTSTPIFPGSKEALTSSEVVRTLNPQKGQKMEDAELAEQLVRFLSERPNKEAASHELVERFPSVKGRQAHLFKRVLHQVAVKNETNGKWRLKV